MKLEITIDDFKIEIQTKNIPTHSLLSDHPEVVEKIEDAIRQLIYHVVKPDTGNS